MNESTKRDVDAATECINTYRDELGSFIDAPRIFAITIARHMAPERELLRELAELPCSCSRISREMATDCGQPEREGEMWGDECFPCRARKLTEEA